MTDGENHKDESSRTTDAKQTAEKISVIDPPDQDKPVHKSAGRNAAFANDNHVGES